LQKEQKIIQALQENPRIPKVDLHALVGSMKPHVLRRIDGRPAYLTIKEAERRCMTDPEARANNKTRKNYESNMRQIHDYYGEDAPLSDVTEESRTSRFTCWRRATRKEGCRRRSRCCPAY
jgi:hypothetical protein